jgi:tetratricopeptide (TPR) repeat protein
MSSKLDDFSKKQGWLFLIGVLLITAICFVPSLYNDWVNWDDPAYVLSNPLVVSDSIQWSAIFAKDQVLGIYHPITLISYAIDYQIWEFNAFGYHLTNVFFHLCNTLLVFLIIKRLNGSLIVAAITALLFGIHPMHVESVTWISERKDVLYLFFLLLAWLSYLRYSLQENRNWMTYSLILLFFGLSILSKPIAFVFPVLLLLTDYFLHRPIRKRILEKIPIFIMAAVAIYIAQWGQADSDSLNAGNTHPVATIFYGSYNFVLYFAKSIAPTGLSIFHPFPLDDSMNSYFYLSLLPLALILSFVYWSYRNSRKIFFGLLFFALTIAPLIQIIPFGKALTSERYTYLPYIGLFFVIAVLIEKMILKKFKWSRFALPIFSGWILFIFISSYQQQAVWKNGETLWTSVIEEYPDDYYAYLARGRYYNEQDQSKRAFDDFNKSIERTPSADALYERGRLFELNGDLQAALNDYTNSLKCDNDFAKPHNNIALIYSKTGNQGKAKYHLERAIKIDAEYSLAHFNLAILLKSQGNTKQALTAIQQAISLESGNLLYIEIRAAISTDLGQFQNAIRDFNTVLKSSPKNGVAHYYLALNYDAIGKKALAKKHFQSALKCNYPVPKRVLNSYEL